MNLLVWLTNTFLMTYDTKKSKINSRYDLHFDNYGY